MNNLLLLFLVIIVGTGIFAQNVNIPDANFKAYLVGNSAINTNMDAEIQTSEASAFTGTINVNGFSIADLTGIEAFTALTYLDCAGNSLTNLNVSTNTTLTTLYCGFNQLTNLNVSANTDLTSLGCSWNQLTSLNISSNTALTYLNCDSNQLSSLNISVNSALNYLSCFGNQLTNLDVSTNTVLTYLDCGGNQLTNLDISTNTALTTLVCYINQLTNLDVSANTALTTLWCGGNQLTNLDVKNGNNINFVAFGFNATNNSNLTCVLVDDTAYMNTNWSSAIDSGAYYNDVSCTLGIKEQDLLSNINLSPNPTKSTFVLGVTSSRNAVLNMSLTNSLGQVVLSEQSNLNTGLNEINFDIQNQPSGIYFMSINYENNHFTKKIMKQ